MHEVKPQHFKRWMQLNNTVSSYQTYWLWFEFCPLYLKQWLKNCLLYRISLVSLHMVATGYELVNRKIKDKSQYVCVHAYIYKGSYRSDWKFKTLLTLSFIFQIWLKWQFAQNLASICFFLSINQIHPPDWYVVAD